MSRQLITFEIEHQLFGIDIAAIREIRVWQAVTRIPGVPPHVIGVANLRGTIIPVLDIALRFGWAATETSERHAIIVVEVAEQLYGLVAESVSDLVEIDGASLQPPPALQDAAMAAFLEGIAPGAGERLIMVLRLEQLVGSTIAGAPAPAQAPSAEPAEIAVALPSLRKGK
ncbi:MAG: chemotaxis protein CheW [Sphingomonadales bacterium]|nr:chemotaxis protein CheW [Sphingomonadales bacterium]